MNDLYPVAQTIEIMIALMLIAAITLSFCKKFKLPFAIVLVMVAMLISYLAHHGMPYLTSLTEINVGPELIIYLCLPTLIFESAFNLDAKEFKENLPAILTLAIPGLLLSTAIIGIFIYLLTPLDFIICLLIGAILSATDPVAVISLFKEIGASHRLTVLVEGESLVNDAIAIVLSKIILMVILTGIISSSTILEGGYDFLFEMFGGILVGISVSVVLAYFLSLIKDDPRIEISLVTVIAYLSFLLSNHLFHATGAMAALAAGLIMGGWGYTKITPAIVTYLKQFLSFISFIAKVIIFFIVGLSTNIDAIIANWKLVLIIVFTMLFSRAVIVGGLIALINRFSNAEYINTKYQTVLWWGGLRGTIALAIVLSLQEIPEKEIISAVVIGAIIFTLLFQGLSIKKLVSWLKLDIISPSDRLAKLETQLTAKEEALQTIPRLQKDGFFSSTIATKLKNQQNKSITEIKTSLQDLKTNKVISNQEVELFFLRCFSMEKSLYYKLFSHGHLAEGVYRNLIRTLNYYFDILRYHENPLEKLAKIDIKESVFSPRHSMILRFKIFKKLVEHIRLRQLAIQYETYWAFEQGSHAILDYLQSKNNKETLSQIGIEYLNNHYQKINTYVCKELDSIAEQFPEFLNSVQTRLAQRMMLRTEYYSVEQDSSAGLIQESIATKLLQQIKDKLYKLQKTKLETLKLDPEEIIRKVSFFSQLSDEQARKIVPLLNSYTVLSGETIVEQETEEDALFLIARGVVRVIQKHADATTTQLATLIAGDFFGETALLYNIKRTATCKAVTPCVLYQLKRSTFEHICSEYHDIGDMIREIDRKRRLSSNENN